MPPKVARSAHSVSVRSSSKRRRLWAFGYAELAELLQMAEQSVRLAVARGRLEPADLASVVAFATRRAKRRVAPPLGVKTPEAGRIDEAE